MLQIRKCIFETNSSSVHSLIIMKTPDYKLWMKSDDEELEERLFAKKNDDGIVTFIKGKDVIEKLKQDSDGYWNSQYKKYVAEDDDYMIDRLVGMYAIYYFGAFPPSHCADITTASVDDYTAVSFYLEEQ